ncbi:MAG: hypothetical protein JNL82_14365 [Myxococcales bacterium]|nr:hypothetical protein [Myxococcales bacterium]
MHEETVKILRSYRSATALTEGAEVYLASATAALIHYRLSSQRSPDPPPAPYARVHAMGHACYVGPVMLLARGVRVEHHTVEQVGEGAWGIVRQWKDVVALHSIEYFGEAEWTREGEQLAAEVARRNEGHRRQTTDPEGYALHMHGANEYGFVTPDGQVYGWWYTASTARAHAWDHAAGDRDDEYLARGPLAELKPPDPAQTRSEPPEGYYVDFLPEDDDDPEGRGEWVWGIYDDTVNGDDKKVELGSEETEVEAIAAAWERHGDDLPSDATAGAPAAESTERPTDTGDRCRGCGAADGAPCMPDCPESAGLLDRGGQV